jgi:uncharacterized protein YycO
MTVDRGALKPGHVLVAATPDKGGWWIRLRSMMMRRDPLHNHVAMVVHVDSTGRWRGLEGRPGGFGWANMDRYLDHPNTIANTDQPLTDEQRDKIVRSAVSAVGLPYDWEAIISFAAGTAGMGFRSKEWPEEGLPSHVVCSSAIDLFYEGAGAANPGGWRQTRGTDPSHWSTFVGKKLW